MQPNHRQTLITGLAYGLGFLLGHFVSATIIAYFPAEIFLTGNQVGRLIRGILWAFLISGFGGVIGGSIGGWTLPPVGFGKGQRGYVWRSGVTFGIGYGFLIFPLVLIIALFSFYDISNTPPLVFIVIFGVVGLVFGVIMGLSLGAWTVGRRFPLITRSSTIGFGLGGMMLGYSLWHYIFAIAEGDVASGPWFWLLMGLFLFGGLGGAALGYAYGRTAEQAEGLISPIRQRTRRQWVRRWTIVGAVLLGVALLIRPVIAAVGDLLTPIDAGLSPVLDLPTDGTHWFDSTPLAEVVSLPQPAIASGPDGQIAVAWLQDGEVAGATRLVLQEGRWSSEEQKSTWQAPAVVIQAADLEGPQVAIDRDGRIHLAWVQKGSLVTSLCVDGDCTSPTPIVAYSVCEDAGSDNRSPALAVSGERVLVVWENAGLLPYAAWPASGGPPALADGCVPGTNVASSPRLGADGNGGFALVFTDNDGEIAGQQFLGEQWSEQANSLGNGHSPVVFIDSANQTHAAWCQEDQVVHWHDGQTEPVATGSCSGRPQIAEDEDGRIHVIWHADGVEKSSGIWQPSSLVLESMGSPSAWTPAAIAGYSDSGAQAAMGTGEDSSLHLVWTDSGQLNYAAQVQYHCDPSSLSEYGETFYEIASRESYLPPGDPVPYCRNQYDGLLISPNPDAAYTDSPTPTNGVFDSMGDMIRQAGYETLFSTMWYDAPANNDSPGSVIAAAVADLYTKVKENPEQYPRGMTVRILLGNPPELAMGELTGQLWTLIDDLRHAGIDKMVDEEIGWRLEVADFEGNMPHSHVKTLIIDGKEAAVNGFNMTYDHFPADHPSGKGGGRFDLGMHITGPAAQGAQRVFDDMWNGADQRHCYYLNLPASLPWQATCFDRTATVDHVPEVQKFFLPGGSSTAFSLYRSKVHDQADQQTVAAIRGAKESIDAIHVNFSLDLICALNILFDVCTVDISPEYQDALIDALQGGANLRLLVKPGPTEGIENLVAIHALADRLSELGLTDRFEIRFFDGPVHTKTALIDDQVLIVGSQNLHYSAYGTGRGLTEYSLAVEDPQATADYEALFEYQWERGTPYE